MMALAEQAGLSDLVTEGVRLGETRVASAGVNPAGKVTSIIAGMAGDADSIDDLQVVRSGGMKRLFAGVYAPATLGQFLREFTHGHVSQLAAVARTHLVNLAGRTDLLPGIEERAFVDIDSLLRPVYGHAKQGASFGHTKISGKQVLRKGLSPLATTISTGHSAPVLSGIRLRAGKAGSGKGADAMVGEAIRLARRLGASGEILVRGDSAFGNSAVVGACLKAKARFSVVLTKNPAVTRAIGTIPDDAWTPVHYPGAVLDPLLRSADSLDAGRSAAARGATLRRQIIHVPARLVRPQRRRVLHLPAHWPWAERWLAIWTGVFGKANVPPQPA